MLMLRALAAQGLYMQIKVIAPQEKAASGTANLPHLFRDTKWNCSKFHYSNKKYRTWHRDRTLAGQQGKWEREQNTEKKPELNSLTSCSWENPLICLSLSLLRCEMCRLTPQERTKGILKYHRVNHFHPGPYALPPALSLAQLLRWICLVTLQVRPPLHTTSSLL